MIVQVMTYVVIGLLAVGCILVVLLSMCRAASHRDDRDFRPPKWINGGRDG